MSDRTYQDDSDYDYDIDQAPAVSPPPVPAGFPPTGQDTESLIQHVIDLVAAGRPMPLSASVMINRDEILELLEAVLAGLPDELKASRWLLKERDEFLAKVHRESDEILEAGRAQVEHMVQRTEVVKKAEHRAQRLVEAAQDEARRMQHECEDFCDQKLASFEIVLDRTKKMVVAGRQKLQATALPRDMPQPEPEQVPENDFFDQDQA